MLNAHLRHAVGVLLLAPAFAPLVVASVRVVAASAPAAPKILRAVGGAALSVAAAQLLMTLLGAVSLLRLIPILVALVATGLVALRFAPRPADPETIEEQDLGGPGRRIAFFALAVGVVQWGFWTLVALHEGVQRDDSLTYHMPTALAFVDSGSVATPVMTVAGSPVGYYTNGTEVLHAMGIVVARSDVLTCLSGMFFAVMAVGACWCIGARFARGWVASLLAVIALTIPAIVQTQAGSALVDIPSAALVLSALALAMWADPDRAWSFVPAILVGGAALAAKLLSLPVVLVVLGYVLWRILGSPDPRRWDRGALFRAGIAIVGVVAASMTWFVRNQVHVGSPIPMLHLPGFTHLVFPQIQELGKTVGSYLRRILTYPGAAHGLPGALRGGFGILWPFLALLLIGVVIVGLRRWREQPLVWIAFAAAALGYLAAPFGAGGPGRPPFLLAVNVRYATLTLLLLAPLVASLATSDRAARWVGRIGLVLLLVAELPTDVFPGNFGYYRLQTWPKAHKWLDLVVALLVGLVVAVRGEELRRVARRFTPSAKVVAAAAGIVLAVVASARNEATSRFTASKDLRAAFSYAETLSNQRIGLVGIDRAYPFAGRNLTNRVQAVLLLNHEGVPYAPPGCGQLRAAIVNSHFTFVVTRYVPTSTFDAIGCVAQLPGVTQVGRSGDVTIWRLPGGSSSALRRTGSALR